MTPNEELSELIGFEIPLSRLTEKFGRPIIDFSKFIDAYRSCYASRTKPIYEEIREHHGQRALILIDQLT